MLKILSVFTITGRGTAVAVEGYTDLPINQKLRARLRRPDGSLLEATAGKSYLLRLVEGQTVDLEAFLLYDVDKRDVPDGSVIEVSI